MGKIIQAQPSNTQFIQTVELAGLQLRIRSTWNDRTASWYADILKLDDSPIWSGLRMTPGWSPNNALFSADAPDGQFYVRGFDGYTQASFGDALKLIFYTTAELATETDDGITVEVN